MTHPLGPFRCITHPRAETIDICAHLWDADAPPHSATEDRIVCEACADAPAKSLLPVCVVCLREKWGLSIRIVLDGKMRG